MTRKPRWTNETWADGLWSVELFSWKYFHDFIRQLMLPYSHYVWRGQRNSSWKLQSSLDRELRGKPHTLRANLARQHLLQFQYATRGRRGTNPPTLTSEDDWWALGQHHGLATPLLDWTESPFVALYFAFERAEKPPTGFRSVWALGGVENKNKQIEEAHKEADDAPVLKYVRPLQDDNSRLVNQAGLFSRVPLGQTVDEWVTVHCKGEESGTLIHVKIPEKERLDCLRTLSKMNINHITLFPDLYGAGEHCNKALRISNY